MTANIVATDTQYAIGIDQTTDNQSNIPQIYHTGTNYSRITVTADLAQFIGQPNTENVRQEIGRIVNNVVQGQLQLGYVGCEYNLTNVGSLTVNATDVTWAATGIIPTYIDRETWVTDYNYNGTSGDLNINCNTALYTYGVVNGNGDCFIQNSQQIQTYLKKQKIKSNLRVQIKSRVEQALTVHKNENKAIDTLHEIISESEFRKYLKYGFILVKGRSGDVYQVFRNRSHTKIWRNGKVIEEVCVRIKDCVPQTDNVIAFKTMIETDEEEFKKCGNIFKMGEGIQIAATNIQICTNNNYQIAA